MYFDHESLDDLIGTSEKYVHVLLYICMQLFARICLVVIYSYLVLVPFCLVHVLYFLFAQT